MESKYNNPPSLNPSILKEVSIPVSVIKFIRIQVLAQRAKSLAYFLYPPINHSDKKLIKHMRICLKEVVRLCDEMMPPE